jgi:hypothetical protein
MKHRFVPLVKLEQTPPNNWRLGLGGARLKRVYQCDGTPCSKGAPLTNCIPSHFYVLTKWHNEILDTNCEDQ